MDEIQASSNNNSQKTLIVLVLLAIIAGTGYFFFQSGGFNNFSGITTDEEAGPQLPQPSVQASLSGSLALALAAYGDDNIERPQQLYSYTLQAQSLDELQGVVQPGSKVVSAARQGEGLWGIIEQDAQGQYHVRIVSSGATATVALNTDASRAKKELNWSPDGTQIVFSERNDVEENIVGVGDIPSEWDILLGNTEGDVVLVASGADQPKFVSDTEVVYLKNNGLYHLDLSTNEENLLFPTPVIGNTFQYDVNTETGTVAWTETRNNRVLFVDVDFDTFEVKPDSLGVINHYGLSPKISPDGNYMAIYTPAPSGVLIYQINSGKEFQELVHTIDLNVFTISNNIISQWSE